MIQARPGPSRKRGRSSPSILHMFWELAAQRGDQAGFSKNRPGPVGACTIPSVQHMGLCQPKPQTTVQKIQLFRSFSGPCRVSVLVLFRSSGPRPRMRFRSFPGFCFWELLRSLFRSVPVLVFSSPCFRSFAVLVLVSGPLSFQSLFPALFVCWSSISTSVCVFHCISTQGSLVFIRIPFSFSSSFFSFSSVSLGSQLQAPDLSGHNRKLQISVGTAGPQPQAPDLSCRTSTGARSQWARPDLNRGRQISVGTAGPQPDDRENAR